MGADIYLSSRIAANREKHPGATYEYIYTDDAYFRDSYNGTSLYWLLGRSWWNDVKLVQPGKEFWDDEDELTEAGRAEALRLQADYLTNFRVFAESFEEKLEAWIANKGGGDCTFDDADNSPDAWREMFRDKLKRWIALQEAAQAIREPLRWSV